jgi:DsbC/DsbD-like thiol-disulfide interchange protein
MSRASRDQTKLKQSKLRLLRIQNKFGFLSANDWPHFLHRYLPLQISFQISNPIHRAMILFACANLSLLIFSTSLYCDPYASTWVSGQKSSLRLIAAGGGATQGFYRAGLEIHLDPGALTYWRMPGGAGVPPVFSFEGSENAASIEVSYPAPVRIDEDGTEAFGYRDSVVFPIHITPEDASRPVLLAVNLSYAVCLRLCLPSKAEVRLTLDPNQKVGAASEGASAIAAAEAEVPLRLTPQQRDTKVTVSRDKTAGSPTWRLSPRMHGEDLFAEGPPGWYFETRKLSPGAFLIVAVEQPEATSQADRKMPVPVILTLKGERQNYEFAIDLDTSPLD